MVSVSPAVNLTTVKKRLASSQRPEAVPDALEKRNLNGGHYIFSMQPKPLIALF
jgi:hypothetical protein